MKKLLVLVMILTLLVNTLSMNVAFAETKSSGETKEQQDTTEPEAKDTVKTTETEGAQLEISSVSAVLIEGSSGEIIYEKNKDEQLKPASITKIMTLLLIFEALDSGKISLTDEVSVSEYAASMGGSQVWLEPYETQTVDDMIKCICIVSANDASVAMAEFIAGSEEEFVARMNEKAKELGMVNTHFENSCGLDTDNHYSSAYDVALMSRELITKHPAITNYSTVWMDSITHVTRKGESTFGLSNTNKLLKSYNGITGLKTGSTSLAKYCLSATAKRDGMDLIAVIMAAPETKVRFSEAAKLLDYGFANCSLYSDDNADSVIGPVILKKGVKEEVKAKVAGVFHYVCLKGVNKEDISKEILLFDNVTAPVKENDKIGIINYSLNGKNIGSVDIIASENVEKATYKHFFGKVILKYFMVQSKES